MEYKMGVKEREYVTKQLLAGNIPLHAKFFTCYVEES